MFAGSFVLVGSVFAVSHVNTPAPRMENGCLEDELAPAIHIVLVDKTDPFGSNFSNQIRKSILSRARSIEMNARLDVYTIRGMHEKRFPPEITLCNPGVGTDYSRLFHNQSKKQRYYKEHFISPLESALDQIVQSGQAASSPILEIVEDITTRPEVREIDGRRTITLISDMAQNSERLRLVHNRHLVDVSEEQIQRGIREIAGIDGLQFEGFSFEVYQVEKEYPQDVIDQVKKTWVEIIAGAEGVLTHWRNL